MRTHRVICGRFWHASGCRRLPAATHPARRLPVAGPICQQRPLFLSRSLCKCRQPRVHVLPCVVVLRSAAQPRHLHATSSPLPRRHTPCCRPGRQFYGQRSVHPVFRRRRYWRVGMPCPPAVRTLALPRGACSLVRNRRVGDGGGLTRTLECSGRRALQGGRPAGWSFMPQLGDRHAKVCPEGLPAGPLRERGVPAHLLAAFQTIWPKDEESVGSGVTGVTTPPGRGSCTLLQGTTPN